MQVDTDYQQKKKSRKIKKKNAEQEMI